LKEGEADDLLEGGLGGSCGELAGSWAERGGEAAKAGWQLRGSGRVFVRQATCRQQGRVVVTACEGRGV